MKGIGKNDFIILQNCIYGLVKVARQYSKKAVEILKKLGFARGNVDPCLYMKKGATGVVYLALYLDDNLMLGNTKAMNKAVKQLKRNWLVVTVMESLWDHLLCKIQF